MNEPISRREFINGTLAMGAGAWLHGQMPPMMSAADTFTGYGGIGDYARSNGNTFEVMNAAHAMRDGAFEKSAARAKDTREM